MAESQPLTAPHAFRRRWTVTISTAEDGTAYVRTGGHVHTGPADDVQIIFSGVSGLWNDQQPALEEAIRRILLGRISWITPQDGAWLIDGEALRALHGSLTELPWLLGVAAITPRYEPREMLRQGNFAARGDVVATFTEQTWRRSQKPWEKHWRVSNEQPRAGGQGIVHKVTARTDVTIIGGLKILHDEDQNNTERRYRFYRETQALRSMNATGTPAIYDTNADKYREVDELLYCVTEFIHGPRLSDRVNKKRLSIADARIVCDRLSHTLERLHDNGQQHRDVKPDNIIVRDDVLADAILLDFGMASRADDEEDAFATERNQEIGNRFLRLPEHAAGSHHDDPRSDITLVAGIFFYAITGVTPRVLIDYDGNPPHKRNLPRVIELAKRPEWPQLRAFFDEAFTIRIEDRIPNWDTFRRRTAALTEQLADPDTAHELQRLNAAANTAAMRVDLDLQNKIVGFSRRFLTQMRDILHGAHIGLDVDERLSPAARDASLTIDAHLPDMEWPRSQIRHTVSVHDDTWRAEFHTDAGQPIRYLNAPLTISTEEIDLAVDAAAQRVVKNLLRHLNYKLERELELRQRHSGPRTILTDLREQFPVGIGVTIDRTGEKQARLHFEFQNNSGVTQPAINVLILIPLPLNATSAGASGEVQEEKYHRFAFDYPDAQLGDRLTLQGPAIDVTLTHTPNDAHLFVRVIAGDHQSTVSPTITDLFATD